jgi:hypothetical protein
MKKIIAYEDEEAEEPIEEAPTPSVYMPNNSTPGRSCNYAHE